jgi:hypothetical protein
MDDYEQDKINKIQSLNLSWITGGDLMWSDDKDDNDVLGHQEVMENVLKDLEESGYDSD